MDPLGNVVRDFLKKAHADNVRNAVTLATELRDDEGMNASQIEEMLHSSGFDPHVIAEAMESLPIKRNNK